MKHFKYYFLVIIILIGVLQYLYLHKKTVKVIIWKCNGKKEIIEIEIPKNANLHLYKHKLQYLDKNNYYQTVYYNVIDFKEIQL